MIKILSSFFLSLCILLLSGYGQLYAHAHQNRICYSPIKKRKGTDHINVEITRGAKTCILKAQGSDFNNANKTEALGIEEEEDEWGSSKRYFYKSIYFIAISQFQAISHLFDNIFRSLRQSRLFSCLLNFRWHLVLQVFRV